MAGSSISDVCYTICYNIIEQISITVLPFQKYEETVLVLY